MTDLQQAIRTRLDSLVNDLEDMVKEEALRMLSESLSGTSSSKASAGSRGRAAPRGRAGGAGGAGATGVAEKVLGYVRQNPGVRAEAVRAALGLNKGAWMKASSALLSDKRLTKRGQRRGTSYSAAR